MSNTTTEYWDVDGQSLHTWAWNIDTLGGRLNVPKFRGEDIKVPYNPGEVWRPKTPDSRIISLAMWVRDASQDGVEASGGNESKVFNENWDALVRLFFVRNRQLQLTRREKIGAGMRVTTARAELASDMAVSMLGRYAGSFVVDLKLADPYFYGNPVSVSLTAGAGPSAVMNDGHDGVVSMSLRFNGPLTNPILTNTTPATDVSVQYVADIPSGEYVDLNTGLYTAKYSDDSNAVANVLHNGSRRWMELLTGINSLELTSEAGVGTVDINFDTPYL